MPVGGLIEAPDRNGAGFHLLQLPACLAGLFEANIWRIFDMSRHKLPAGWHILIAGTIAVLCAEVSQYVCRTAAMAVDAWNEAAGRPLFVMSETHPAHGRKVLLKRLSEPQGDCGLHGTFTKSGSVSVIYVNLSNPLRCHPHTTLLHELGHSLGLTHDHRPLSRSIMRVPTGGNQRKPHPIDIERLNAIRAGAGAD